MPIVHMTFSVSSAIVGPCAESDLAARVQPLHDIIEAIPSVSGCTVDRYRIFIRYNTNNTNPAVITNAVQNAITEVSKLEGFFPYRTTTPPTVSPRKRNGALWSKIVATFSTPLYPTGANYASDVVATLEKLLGTIDGVGHTAVSARRFDVQFDARVTDAQTVIDQVRKIIASILRDRASALEQQTDMFLFPAGVPEITYDSRETDKQI